MFYNGAGPYKDEMNFIEKPDYEPLVKIEEKDGGLLLKLEFDKSVLDIKTSMVTTARLGTTIVSEAVFEHPDGSPYVIDRDLMGIKRKKNQPGVGPLEQLEAGLLEIVIW